MNKIKKLEVYKRMLVVVDMVNGFVREGVLHDEKIADIIPRQLELIKEAQANNNLVVFIKDTHDIDAVEFGRFGNVGHCVRGTSEAELVSEFRKFEDDDDTLSIEKNSTSFMEAPDFRSLIGEAVNLERIDVVGCCTDICVANGTIGMANYLDQNNRNVKVVVHADAIATYAEDKREEYVKAALLLMEQQGIKINNADKRLVKNK